MALIFKQPTPAIAFMFAGGGLEQQDMNGCNSIRISDPGNVMGRHMAGTAVPPLLKSVWEQGSASFSAGNDVGSIAPQHQGVRTLNPEDTHRRPNPVCPCGCRSDEVEKTLRKPSPQTMTFSRGTPNSAGLREVYLKQAVFEGVSEREARSQRGRIDVPLL
jgi:hypothetical protein